MLRALGFADGVPSGDADATSSLPSRFKLDARPDLDATRRLMPVFSRPQPNFDSLLAAQPNPTRMKTYFDTFTIPSGDFSIAFNEAGAVIATAFGNETDLLARFKSDGTKPIRDSKRGAAARSQVRDYFSGKRKAFDLPLAPVGSTFQISVWTALQEIPFGETRSYGALAQKLKSAARAVGRATALNPICLMVPCHRVIGADGSLTGFAFGKDVKRQLLQHESVTIVA